MVFLDPDAAVIIRRTFLFRIMEAEGSDRNAVLDTDIRLVSGFRIPAVFHVNSRIRILIDRNNERIVKAHAVVAVENRPWNQ